MDGEVVGWCNANDLTRYTHLDDHGATIVRIPYRVTERPESEHVWNRPYRISTALSFLDDLKARA